MIRIFNSIRYSHTARILTACLLLACGAAEAWGTAYTWNGGGGTDTSWTNVNNWGGSGYPGLDSSDTAAFTGSSTVSVTIDVPVTITTLYFNCTNNSTYTSTYTSTITLNFVDDVNLTVSGTTYLGSSNGSPVPPASNVVINGSGDISSGYLITDTVDDNQQTNNTLTIRNYGKIEAISNIYFDHSNSTSMELNGDGTGILKIDSNSGYSGANSITYKDNNTTCVSVEGPDTYSLSYSTLKTSSVNSIMLDNGTSAVKKILYKITASGFTPSGSSLNCSVACTVTGGTTTNSCAYGTTYTLYAPSSTMTSVLFTLTIPSGLTTNTGFTMTFYLQDGTTEVASLSYTQGAYMWTGSATSGSAWDNTGNWGNSTIPTSTSVVTIPGSCTNYPDITVNAVAESVTIEDGATLTISTGTLSVTTLTVQNGGRLSLTGSGTLTATTLTVEAGGTVEASAGTINATTVTVDAGGTFTLSGTLNTTKMVISGSGEFNAASGTVNFTGTSSTWTCGQPINSPIGNLSIASNCTLTPSSDMYVSGTWTNYGTAEVGTHALSFAAYAENDSDTVTVSTGSITMTGTADSSISTVSVTGSSAVDSFISSGSGKLTLSSLTLTSGKSVKFNASGAGSSISVAAAVYNSADITTDGSVTLSSGTVGTVTVNSGSSLTLAGGMTTGAVSVTGTLTTLGTLTVFSMTLASGSSLSLGGDLTLTGNWTNNGATTFAPGTNAVVFTPSSTSTIGGSAATSFYNLTCDGQNGKELDIDKMISVTGTLTLSGTSAGNLIIGGTSGSGIKLTTTQTGGSYLTVNTDDVKIYDSTGTTAGGSIYTATYSKNSSNNTGLINGWNLLSGSLAYVWNGSSSTSWSTAVNWNTGIAPAGTGTEAVDIPYISGATFTGTPYYPVLTSDVSVGTLAVDADAALDCAGRNITAATAFTNNGTLRFSGSPNTITLSSGTASYGSSNTVEYYGGGECAAASGSGAPAAVDYHNLTTGSGTIVQLGSQSITVAGTLSNEGTIEVNGTGVFNIAGTADTDSGLVKYSSTTTTTIPALSYYNLEVSGGTWTDVAALTALNNIVISGGQLTCANKLTAGTDLSVSGGTLKTNGNLSVTGALAVSAGTMQMNNAGSSACASSAGTCSFTGGTVSFGTNASDTFTVGSSGISFSSGLASLSGAGTLTATGSTITLGKNVTLNNTLEFVNAVTLGGSVELATGASSYGIKFDGDVTCTTNTLTTSGSGTVTIASGKTLSSTTGSLIFGGAVTNGGTLSSTSSSFTFNGAVSNNGTISAVDVNLYGNLDNSGGTQFTSTGTATLHPPDTLSIAGNATEANASKTSFGTLSLTGAGGKTLTIKGYIKVNTIALSGSGTSSLLTVNSTVDTDTIVLTNSNTTAQYLSIGGISGSTGFGPIISTGTITPSSSKCYTTSGYLPSGWYFGTYTWLSAAATTAWTTASNWDNNAIPYTSSDAVVIPSSSKNPVYSSASDAIIKSLSLSASDSKLTVNGTGNIQLASTSSPLSNTGTIVYDSDGRILDTSSKFINDVAKGTVEYAQTTSGTITDYNTGTTSSDYDYYNLTLSGSGTFSNSSATIVVGNTFVTGTGSSVNSLTSLIVDGTASISSTVTTTGVQIYTGNITLGGDTVFTANTDLSSGGTAKTVTFSGTVTGGGTALTFGGSSMATDVSFGGSVSGIAVLTVNGAVTVNTPSVTTTGAQTYTGNVTVSVASDVTFTGGSGSLITFGGTLTGYSTGYGVAVAAAGAKFSGAVTKLRSLTCGAAAEFDGTVSGVTALAVSGNAVFGGAVTSTGTVSVTGTTSVNTPTITTTGTQIYTGSVTLGADTVLTAYGSGAAQLVTFGGAVTGDAHSLILGTVSTAPTDVSFGGTVSGVTALAVSGAAAVNTPSVTTTGVQTYTGNVKIGKNTTLTASRLVSSGVFSAAVYSVTVDGAVENNGTLSSTSGTVTIDGNYSSGSSAVFKKTGGRTTFKGDVTFIDSASNDFGSAGGTLVFAGRTGQTFKTGGAVNNKFYGLEFENTGTERTVAVAGVLNQDTSSSFSLTNSSLYTTVLTVSAGTEQFASGAMTLAPYTKFTQTGTNTGTQSTASITLADSTSVMQWDNGDDGGTLTVNGDIINSGSGTLNFHKKSVSFASNSTVGNLVLYDLVIPEGTTVTLNGNIRVRRDMKLEAGGKYVPGSNVLTLGNDGTSSSDSADGYIYDLNGTPVNLGTVNVYQGSTSKTFGANTGNSESTAAADASCSISILNMNDTGAGTIRINNAAVTVLNVQPSSESEADLEINTLTAADRTTALPVFTTNIGTLNTDSYMKGDVTIGLLPGDTLTVTNGLIIPSSVHSFLVAGTVRLSGGALDIKSPLVVASGITAVFDTSSGNNGAAFSGTVDGGTADSSITVTAGGGTVTFGGAVGAAVALNTVTVTSAGGIALNGGAVTTGGLQTYSGPVTLGAGTACTGSTVTFGSSVDGNYALTVTGNAVFNGLVGSSEKLASLDVSGTGMLSGSRITTTGVQTYRGAVTLGAKAELAGTTVTFRSAVDNNRVLIVTGNAAFDGIVGGSENLTSLAVSGTTMVNTSEIKTTGLQSYTEAVTFGGSLGAAEFNAGDVLFGSTVDGGSDAVTEVNIVSTGTVTFGGETGKVKSLKTVTVGNTDINAQSIKMNGGAVVTNGWQSYYGPVTLGADTVFTACTDLSSGGTAETVTFGGAVTGGAHSLVLGTVSTAPTDVSFDGTVSGVTALAVSGNAVFGGAVTSTGTVSVTGTTSVNTPTITTTGTQIYTGSVTLGADTVLTAYGSSAAQLVTFGEAVTGGTHSLILGTVSTAPTDVSFGGTVSGVTTLGVSGAAAVDTSSITTTGSQTYTGAVTLGTGTTLTAYGSGAAQLVTFGGTVTGGTHSMTLGTVSTAPTNVNFDSTVSGITALTISGNAVFGGAVSSTGTVSVSGTTAVNTPSVTTTSTQLYAGDVTLGTSTALTGSGVTFGSGLNGTTSGSQNLTIDTGSSSGTIAFSGAVGGVVPPGDIVLTGAASFGSSFKQNTANSFMLTEGSVSVLQYEFTAGDVSITSGTFTQTGYNSSDGTSSGTVYSQSAASLTTASGTTMNWDSGDDGGSLTVSGNITASGTFSFHHKDLTISGALSIDGNITLLDLVVNNGGSVTIHDGANLTVMRHVTLNSSSTFSNTGTGTLHLTNTTSSSVADKNGIIQDNNATNRNLGDVVITQGTTAKTFSTAVTADTVTMSDTTASAGAVTFGGLLTVTTLTNGASGTIPSFDIAFDGGTAVTGAVAFYTTGTVTLGNDSADSCIFTGGISHTDAVTMRTTVIGGSLTTSDAPVTFDNLILDADASVTTKSLSGSGAGIIIKGTVTNSTSHALSLTAGSGNIQLAGAVGTPSVRLGAVTIVSAYNVAGDDAASSIPLTAAGSLYAESLTQKAGSGTTKLSSADLTGVMNLTVTGTGIVADGTITALSVTLTGGFVDLNGTVTAPSGFSSTGTAFENTGAAITTTDNTLTIAHTGAVTVGAELSTGSTGAGDVTVSSSSSTVVVSAAVTSGTGKIDIDSGDTLTVSAALAATTGNVSVDSTNAAVLSSTADITTTTGNVVFGASKAGTLSTAGDITTSGVTADGSGSVTFTRAVMLTGGVVITTDNGGSTGGAVTFSTTADSDAVGTERALTIDAGTGAVTFTGVVGSTPLASLTLTNSGALTFTNALTVAGALTQTNAATGAALFGGSTATAAATSVGSADLNGTSYTLYGDFTVTSGSLSVTNSGLFLSAENADIDLTSGSFTQDGSGMNQLAGGITTHGTGAVTFATDVYLYGSDTNGMTLGGGSGAVTVGASGTKDLHIAASTASKTITIASPLTAENIVLYGGTLSLGAAVTANADLVLLNGNTGTMYTDSATGLSTLYAYNTASSPSRSGTAVPSLSSFPSVYPDGITFIDGSTTAYCGAVSGLSGRTLTAGQNFYDNGVDLTGTAAWTLALKDNSTATNAFAEAYNCTIAYCTVTCTTSGGSAWVSAAENCTNNGNNTDQTNSTADGIAFSRPVILVNNAAAARDMSGTANMSGTYTVYDDVIRVEFVDSLSAATPLKIENSRNEIYKAVSGIQYYSGSSLVSFTGTYTDADCTTSTGTAADGSGSAGDLSVFYIKASSAWNTDATGISAGQEDTLVGGIHYDASTDRSGTHRNTIPCLNLPKALSSVYATLRDCHKNRIGNYDGLPSSNNYDLDGDSVNDSNTAASAGRFTAVADRASPVLIAAYTGQETHTAYSGTAASQPYYDAHNFIEFVYSEAVNIGDLTYNGGAENVQAQTTFASSSEHGGALINNGSSAASGITITGLASTASGYVVTGKRGSTGSDTTVSSLYRKFSLTAGGTDQIQTGRIRISIAGYVDGTVTVNGSPYLNWSGYIDSAVTPSGTVASAANRYITDRAGTVTDDSASAAETTNHKLNTLTITNTETELYGHWDTSAPVFAPFRSVVAEKAWKEYADAPENYEAIGNSATGSTGSTLDRIEFHLFDNTPSYSEGDSYAWFSRRGWCTNDLSATLRKTYSYAADLFGGSRPFDDTAAARTSGGIRYSSLCESASAFKYAVGSDMTPVNSFDTSAPVTGGANGAIFSTTTDIYNSTGNVDSLYFAVYLSDTTLARKSKFTVSYDADTGFVTDLAGNRLKSATINTIDLTPPEFNMTISPVGNNFLYVVFSKKLNLDELLWIDDSETHTSYSDPLSLIPENLELVDKSTGSPSTGIAIDEAIPAVKVFQNDDYTGLIFKLKRSTGSADEGNVRLSDIESVYVRIKNIGTSTDPVTGLSGTYVSYIQDSIGNSMPLYDAHAFSDFAVNVVNPQYAYNIDDDSNISDVISSYHNDGSWSVHDWSADQNNYGTLMLNKGVLIHAGIADGTDDGSGGLPANVTAYFDPNPQSNALSVTYNSNTSQNWRIWLPGVTSDIFEALAPINNPLSGTGLISTAGAADDEDKTYMNFTLASTDLSSKGWKAGDQVKFLFGIMDSSGNPVEIRHVPVFNGDSTGGTYSGTEYPLFALRLTQSLSNSDSLEAAGKKIASSLDLWSFKLKSLVSQRGGVTILNNVINASTGESTVVKVTMPSDGNLSVVVMTLDGDIVQYLQHGTTTSGDHYYKWNGTTKSGKRVARGMYFVRVFGTGIDETRKVMVVKE